MGASLEVPSLFSPLPFHWQLPERQVEWARVQLYDAGGGAVWNSSKDPVAEALWNGIGSEGPYAGQAVAAGEYYWRVKMQFPDGLEARLDPRPLTLQ
jgi:hypothetical protein